MLFYSLTLEKLLKKWPGKRLFGIYRFLPIFFVAGAALEFSMIKLHVNGVNFYDTYKRKRIDEMVEERLNQSV